MKKIAVVFLVLAGLAAIAWLARPAYRAHKEKKFSRQALDSLKAHQPRRALLNAQQALVLNASNLIACRVMADLADLSRSPHAVVWRRRVAEIEPSLDNRIILAACALRYEPPPFSLTTQTLDEVATKGQGVVAYHLVRTQLALRQNRMADAEKYLERAIELEPTNGLHRLNLAVLRLESKDAAASAAARAELERLRADADLTGNALRALVVHHAARKQFGEAGRHSTALLRSTNVLFGDKLEHLAILHGSQGAELKSFLAKVQGEAATNALYAADLVTRMSALGQAREAVAWTKTLPLEVQREMPLPAAITEAYGAMQDWRGIEEFLRGQQWREREFLRQALLAQAVRKQDAEAVAAVHWREAVQLASERSELLLVLAQLSANWNWTNETEALLWQAARSFPRERWPVDSLGSSYTRMRSARGLLDLQTLLIEREPTNVVVQNNWASLALLLQTNVARAHQLARQVYERDTNNYGFVSTYAWSLHVQGRTAEGLGIIERLKPAQLADPSVASYYGAMLAAAGQKEKAQEYFAKLDGASVLPEELALAHAHIERRTPRVK